MATATNRAALQTALLSIRGLRRRRLGHISPTHYPENGLDKWGRKHNGNNGGGMPSNLLVGGGSRRPAPRASLVLGGEGRINSTRRRRSNGLHVNGASNSSDNNNKNGVNNGGARLATSNRMMDQQRLAIANNNSNSSSRRYVNGSSQMNGLAIINNNNGSSPPSHLNNANNDTATNNKEKKKKDKHGKYTSDLIVVLDMDECLIHSQFLSDVDKYRQAEERPSSSSSTSNSSSSSSSSFEPGGGHHTASPDSLFLNACDSFRISLPDGDLVNVNKRPNLDLFLREITSKFETYIFTAAMEVYAEPVLNKLDPNGTMFSGRFYREHCSYDSELGVYAKDLCDVLRMRKMMITNDATMSMSLVEGKKSSDEEVVVGSRNSNEQCRCNEDLLLCGERRVVLVDNNPLSFLPNPSNGILVSSFYDDPKDDTLEAVMELLHELDDSEDVRPILDDRFGLKDALDDVVKGASVGW